MNSPNNEVWITGIGLVSSLGEGSAAHWQQLTTGAQIKPVLERSAFAPYPVHPLVDVDYSKQIPRRSDQRQMGAWQKLGTYAAGLALDDAGMTDDTTLLENTSLIVAAGGGERDIDVDTTLLETIGGPRDEEAVRNEILMNDLRPTHFLTELSNLMAGNISIVHGVIGSSRTFMGEEMAGFSAVETAARRIQHGQGNLFLVGGAYNAERQDMLLQLDLGTILWTDEYAPLWERPPKGGGMITGSVGAFLVMESSQHAQKRGARAYARLSGIASGRSDRRPGSVGQMAEKLFAALGGHISGGPLGVLSGASGIEPATNQELAFMKGLEDKGYELALRGYGAVLGHSVEAHFPAGLGLAALAASKGAFYTPFDDSGFERPSDEGAVPILVTTWGPFHGEGMALVEKVN